MDETFQWNPVGTHDNLCDLTSGTVTTLPSNTRGRDGASRALQVAEESFPLLAWL